MINFAVPAKHIKTHLPPGHQMNEAKTKTKTVYLGMIADIMHPGLTRIISEGAKHGELVVGLFTDRAVASRKRLPFLSYEQRREVVESIKGVSRVVPQDEWSYIPNILKFRPDCLIHGDDWKNGAAAEMRQKVFDTMAEIGGEVIESPTPTESILLDFSTR